MSGKGRPERELLPRGGKARSAKGAPIRGKGRPERELLPRGGKARSAKGGLVPTTEPGPARVAGPALAGFAERLIAWQRKHGRHDLPWQRTRDPYRIWISEIMLQQTQVGTVLPYYQRFLEAFPDVQALAAAAEDEVMRRWSGLGYYRRARHLHAAARRIVAEQGAVFPRDPLALATLPGIGRSTAAAIVAFAFGTPAAILDGNVKRVLTRHGLVEGFPGTPAVERRLWIIAEGLLPSRDIEAYTQGMMDLGATLCTRMTPRCGECPVAGDCRARTAGRVAEFPTPRPARELPRRAVQMLLLEAHGELLLEKREADTVWQGLWSLPEFGLDEDVAVACARRYGCAATITETLAPIRHGFTHYRLDIHPVRATGHRRPAVETPGRIWLAPGEALGAALPAPVRRLLERLYQGLG